MRIQNFREWRRRRKLTACAETIRKATAKFKSLQPNPDRLYFGKIGLAGVLKCDAARLEEVLSFMEKKGWAKPTGYRDTYEIF